MSNQKPVNWVIFILLSIIWGSSFILMKKGAEHLTGWQIGALRIFSAGVVFLPFAVFYLFSVPGKKLPLIFLSGLLGNLFPAFLFALAIERIDSSMEGILNSLTPLFVILIGKFFFKRQMENRKLAGVLTGFIGLVILGLSRGPMQVQELGYTFFILLATVCYGLNVNIVSLYLKEVDPLKMAALSLAMISIPAGLILWQQSVFSLVWYDSAALFSVMAAVLLGLVGSAVATALFYVLIKKAGGLFASLVTYAIPPVSILWGLLDHENVTLVQIGCLGIILGGVYLANK